MLCMAYYKMSLVTIHYTHLIQGEISVYHFITHLHIVQCCVGIKDVSMKACLNFRQMNMYCSRWWYILTNTASVTKTSIQYVSLQIRNDVLVATINFRSRKKLNQIFESQVNSIIIQFSWFDPGLINLASGHVYRACTCEIYDPSRLVRYFAEVIYFAWHRIKIFSIFLFIAVFCSSKTLWLSSNFSKIDLRDSQSPHLLKG